MTTPAPYSRILPEGLACYRRIGPFTEETIPAGLLKEHRLKEGTWGRLLLRQGSLTMVWDDGSGERERLVAPAELHVAPQRPHHVELDGPLELEIEFLAAVI